MNYLNSDYQLSMAQKEEITKTLYQKGIFNIKGSVPIVARLLKISEPSVYRYLKILNHRNYFLNNFKIPKERRLLRLFLELLSKNSATSLRPNMIAKL